MVMILISLAIGKGRQMVLVAVRRVYSKSFQFLPLTLLSKLIKLDVKKLKSQYYLYNTKVVFQIMNMF